MVLPLGKDVVLNVVETSSMTAPTLTPVKTCVNDVLIHYGVVIPVTTLVLLLFIIVFIQLLLILYFGYKLLSYQTVFLGSVLVWAGLRLVLYSFYFDKYSCQLVNHLQPVLNWFLISFPQSIQFFTLSLLVHYFGQLFFKTIQERIESRVLISRRSKRLICFKYISTLAWLATILIFFSSNLGFSLYVFSLPEVKRSSFTLARVLVSEALFLIMAFLLSLFIIIIYTTSVGRSVLEAQRTPKYKAILLSLLIVIVFTTRCLYNIIVVQKSVVALTYGYSWTNVSDLADNEWQTPNGYISYFIVLLVWEVLPTYLIVWFFRVKTDCSVRCCMICQRARRLHSPSGSPKSYFIPRRPPVNEAAASINRTTKVDIPPSTIPKAGYSYGTTDPNSIGVKGNSHFRSPAVMPGTSNGPFIMPGQGGNLFKSK